MINLKRLIDLSKPNVRGYDPAKNQLASGVTSDKIKKQVAALESEWERLDSQGTNHTRQMEIQKEIARLWREKERWDDLYKSSDMPVSENEQHPDDYVLLGANWADGTVTYAISHDPNGRHPASMLRADNRWRFVPEINYLAWWVRPSEEEKELVSNYLAGKGFKVKNNGALGYLKESVSKGNDVVFGGIWSTERIVAYVASDSTGYGHTREMGSNRWTYHQDMGTVFWKHMPDDDDRIAVENWLAKRGYAVKSHRKSDEYWALAIQMANAKKKKQKLPEGKWLTDASQAILTDEPQLYFTENYEGTHLEIVKRLFPEEMEEAVREAERAGYGHSEQVLDAEYHAANVLARRHKFARVVVENGSLYFNTEQHEQPSNAQMRLLKNYCLENGLELVHSMGLKKQYIDLNENKKLIMEAKQDEAALDFLKQMVRKGPFRGKVYLAGGAVRDMIRGEVPKDLDVVVTDNGADGGMKFAKWLAQQMGNYKEGSNPVLFPTFGTAKVILTGVHNGVNLDGFDVESVFARKEVYTPGSRKPEVFPGTIEDDAYRRDFTVNSMMLDLTTDKILDITGHGKTDIAAGLIRTTSNPDEIFGQDALRMFRAIRFATKYKWKIDPATWEGIRKNLSNLSNTSMERVRDELDKILMTKDPAYGIRLLRDSGLLPHVAPELQQAVGMTQNKHHKDDVFDHTMEVLKNTKPELVQRLMALFHDIGKVATREETPTGVHFIGHENVGADVAERIMRDLKYPLDLVNAVKLGVHQHMRLKHGKDEATMSDSTLRKFKIALGDNLEHVLDVIHADNISHADASSMPNQIARVRERLKTLDVQVKKPNLPINGMDLQAIGVKQGPMIGKILGAITDAWYENPNITREQALAIAQSML